MLCKYLLTIQLVQAAFHKLTMPGLELLHLGYVSHHWERVFCCAVTHRLPILQRPRAELPAPPRCPVMPALTFLPAGGQLGGALPCRLVPVNWGIHGKAGEKLLRTCPLPSQAQRVNLKNDTAIQTLRNSAPGSHIPTWVEITDYPGV
jgi:hypothetical protein